MVRGVCGVSMVCKEGCGEYRCGFRSFISNAIYRKKQSLTILKKNNQQQKQMATRTLWLLNDCYFFGGNFQLINQTKYKCSYKVWRK